MAQVAVQDVSTGSADATTVDVTHIVNSDEGLVVGVVLEIADDTSKEVASVVWDTTGVNEALTLFDTFSPTHGKLRLEVYRRTRPTAATAIVRTTIDEGNSQKTGVTCVSVTNMSTSTPLEGAVEQEGTGSTGSVSVTQEADDLAFCFAGHLQATSSFEPLSGESEHADFFIESVFACWAASEDGTTATTLGFTQAESKEFSILGFNINSDTAEVPGGTNYDMRSYPRSNLRGVMRGVMGLLPFQNSTDEVGYEWLKNVNLA